MLRGDRRLAQALLNYLGNAVRIYRARIDPPAQVGAGGQRHRYLLVRFEVRDTGIGIAEALPRLFEAFEQADSSITPATTAALAGG